MSLEKNLERENLKYRNFNFFVKDGYICKIYNDSVNSNNILEIISYSNPDKSHILIEFKGYKYCFFNKNVIVIKNSMLYVLIDRRVLVWDLEKKEKIALHQLKLESKSSNIMYDINVNRNILCVSLCHPKGVILFDMNKNRQIERKIFPKERLSTERMNGLNLSSEVLAMKEMVRLGNLILGVDNYHNIMVRDLSDLNINYNIGLNHDNELKVLEELIIACKKYYKGLNLSVSLSQMDRIRAKFRSMFRT